MRRFHVKKDDVVVVLSGTEKGKRGRVIRLLPDKQRVIVEGVKIVKRHQKKSQQNPQGGIIKREGTVHLSKVMKAERYDARAAARAAKAAPAGTDA
jgi:large subunit ribosomal protein L24